MPKNFKARQTNNTQRSQNVILMVIFSPTLFTCIEVTFQINEFHACFQLPLVTKFYLMPSWRVIIESYMGTHTHYKTFPSQ